MHDHPYSCNLIDKNVVAQTVTQRLEACKVTLHSKRKAMKSMIRTNDELMTLMKNIEVDNVSDGAIKNLSEKASKLSNSILESLLKRAN